MRKVTFGLLCLLELAPLGPYCTESKGPNRIRII